VQSLDRLDVDTPEQIALELPLAGIGSRFLALAIDSLLQVILLVVLSVVGLMIAGSFIGAASGRDRFFSQTLGAIVLVLVPFCLYWGYFAFFEILWHGKTPGKRMAGIRVIHESGRPLTAIECIGRNLMRGVDILPGIYAVGIVCMMCNKQNRRVGDYVVGAIVVHDQAVDSVAPFWGDPVAREPVQPQFRSLHPDELVLIETYLSRRYELDPIIRATTAQRIVAMVMEKTGVQKSSDQSDDDFLEGAARQLRNSAFR
jgi:uncharacterized RDD family membrane protein YckC